MARKNNLSRKKPVPMRGNRAKLKRTVRKSKKTKSKRA